MFIWNRWRHVVLRFECLERRVRDLEAKTVSLGPAATFNQFGSPCRTPRESSVVTEDGFLDRGFGPAKKDGAISSITIDNPGSGYTGPPLWPGQKLPAKGGSDD